MIAFLVFCVLMVAFVVGCVRISMRLHTQNWAMYLAGHQFVALKQSASIERRSSKQTSSQFDVEMGECMRRVAAIGLVVVAIIVVLVIAFINVAS